jgi:hypothetical protein
MVLQGSSFLRVEKCPNGLERNLGLIGQRRRLGVGCLQDYGVKHHPFRTLNGRLNIILGFPKGVSPLKRLGQLEVVPLKLESPNSKKGLSPNDSGRPNLSRLNQLWELVPEGLGISLGLIQLMAMWFNFRCYNLNLGLTTKARVYKGVGQE